MVFEYEKKGPHGQGQLCGYDFRMCYVHVRDICHWFNYVSFMFYNASVTFQDIVLIKYKFT